MPLHWKASACLLLATVFAAPPANATMALIADGTLTDSAAGHLADLSGLTGTLENGDPANLLGGLGSGIAYAGGNTFLAVPDRGPNAVSYNSKVDDTVSYINRFQTVTMSLTPNASGAALPFTLTPTLTATILLSSPTPLTYGSGVALRVGSGAPAQNTATQFYFTERSDNFDSTKNSGNPKQCALRSRIDPGLEPSSPPLPARAASTDHVGMARRQDFLPVHQLELHEVQMRSPRGRAMPRRSD